MQAHPLITALDNGQEEQAQPKGAQRSANAIAASDVGQVEVAAVARKKIKAGVWACCVKLPG